MLNFDLNDRSDQILSAALHLFKQYGFKRTSMDDIAEAANMSRAALYLIFKNKTDIFRSLSQRFHDTTLETARNSLNGSAPVEQRIVKAITARMVPMYALAHESVHGLEISDANRSISADINTDAETTFLLLLTNSLQASYNAGEMDTGPENLAARELAQIFIATAVGLKSLAFSTKDFETLLVKSVTTLFQGIKIEY